jgi:hypothetical protein
LIITPFLLFFFLFLKDGCYHLDIGGGKYSGADRSSATLCGITTPFPVSATLCLENNATTCSLTDVAVASCNTGLYPVKLLKIDSKSTTHISINESIIFESFQKLIRRILLNLYFIGYSQIMVTVGECHIK